VIFIHVFFGDGHDTEFENRSQDIFICKVNAVIFIHARVIRDEHGIVCGVGARTTSSVQGKCSDCAKPSL